MKLINPTPPLMKIILEQQSLLEPKKCKLPRLFQKITWTWVVRLQRYDNNPTFSNYLYYCYLHYASCNEYKNYVTANSYFENMLLINKIKYNNINPLRFSKETSTIKSFNNALKNQNFKENVINFLNADNISDAIIQDFIKNNMHLKYDLNATVIKERNNDPTILGEQVEKEKTQIKIREGVDLRTYKIVWEMRDKNLTNDSISFENKLEFETAFRLWMKDTFGVNTMEKETIGDNWNFSYKNRIIELKEKGKSLFYLGTQLRQIIANEDIFEAMYVIEAKKILADFS